MYALFVLQNILLLIYRFMKIIRVKIIYFILKIAVVLFTIIFIVSKNLNYNILNKINYIDDISFKSDSTHQIKTSTIKVEGIGKTNDFIYDNLFEHIFGIQNK